MKRNLLFLGLEDKDVDAGSKLEGCAVVVINKAVPARSVWLRWEGREYASWWQGLRLEHRCQESRTIICERQQLWTAANEDEVLQPGTHTLPFSVQVPQGVPSSIEDDGVTKTALGSVTVADRSLAPKSYGDKRSFIRYVVNVYVDTAINGAKLDEQSQQAAEGDHADDTADGEQKGDQDEDQDNNGSQQGDGDDNNADDDGAGEKNGILLSSYSSFTVHENADCDAIRSGPTEPVSAEKTYLMSRGRVPTRIEVQLPYGGHFFVAHGLLMKIKAEAGGRRIDEVRLSLVEHVELRAKATPQDGSSGASSDRQSFVRSCTVCKGTVPNSMVEQGAVWSQEAILPVPSDLGPSIAGQLVRRSYDLQVEARGPLMSSVSVQVPVNLYDIEPPQSLNFHEIAKFGEDDEDDEQQVAGGENPTGTDEEPKEKVSHPETVEEKDDDAEKELNDVEL